MRRCGVVHGADAKLRENNCVTVQRLRREHGMDESQAAGRTDADADADAKAEAYWYKDSYSAV